MKRSAVLLGTSAIALFVAAGPAGASATSDHGQATTQASAENAQAFDQTPGYSEPLLIGTGALFLALGIGTLSGAHRRRWREIDIREQAVDATPATAGQP
jgi:hypothetical protein